MAPKRFNTGRHRAVTPFGYGGVLARSGAAECSAGAPALCFPPAHCYLTSVFASSQKSSDFSRDGCPAWIRTMTRRVKVACATITPPGSRSGRRKPSASYGTRAEILPFTPRLHCRRQPSLRQEALFTGPTPPPRCETRRESRRGGR